MVIEPNGDFLCDVSLFEAGSSPSVGEVLVFEGIDGRFRITEIQRYHKKVANIEGVFRSGEATAFVIPISEIQNREPHND